MASQSQDKAEGKSGGNRAGLPFEPKGKRAIAKGDSAAETPSTSEKSDSAIKSDKKSKKASGKKVSASDISARAQARADEILAGNRRKAKAKSAKSASSAAGGAAKKKNNSGAIPEEVSRRMMRRMGVLSISPVALGVGVFFLAYYLTSRQIVELPHVAVLLVTMGCFGLGVLGLTYGVLSASWDSEPGSLIGFSEFKLNFGRVMDARKASKT